MQNEPINPYEVPRPFYDQWQELLREKLRCERAKNLALEVGRLGIVMGLCMFFVAFVNVIEQFPLNQPENEALNFSWSPIIGRLGIGLGLIIVGMVIAYPLYLPYRKRLNELELLLPSAEVAPDSDETELEADENETSDTEPAP